jgi:hypothetical protein
MNNKMGKSLSTLFLLFFLLQSCDYEDVTDRVVSPAFPTNKGLIDRGNTW